MRVIVPFGPRKIMGFIIGFTDESSHNKLKEILNILDLTPVLTKELLELGRWIAEETISFYITSLQAMLPQVLKAQYKKEIIRLGEEGLPTELEHLFAGRSSIPFEEFENSSISYYQLQKAVQDGDIAMEYLVKSKITKKYVTMLKPGKPGYLLEEALIDLSKQAKKQHLLLSYFIEHPEPVEKQKLKKSVNVTDSTVKTLVDKQLLETERVEVYRNPYNDKMITRTKPMSLTSEQKAAIKPINENIAAHEHDVVLLHGV